MSLDKRLYAQLQKKSDKMHSFYSAFEHHFLFPKHIANIENQEFYNPNVENNSPKNTPVFNEEPKTAIKEALPIPNSQVDAKNYEKTNAPDISVNMPAMPVAAPPATNDVPSPKPQEKQEYFSLERLAKIPGTKAISTLYNSTLPKYRQKFEKDNESSEAYFMDIEQSKTKKFVYALREELLNAILINPSDSAIPKQDILGMIKQTEDNALTDILNKIAAQDTVWITTDDLSKLQDIKSYDSLRKVMQQYGEKKPSSIAIPCYEYKLTKELVKVLFKTSDIADFIIEAFVEKEAAKASETNSAKTNTLEDSIPDPAEKQITTSDKINPFKQVYEPQESTQKSKKQSRRDKQEADKEEIRQYIVTKVIGTGLSKIGSNRTDINNLPKGLPSHLKGLAKDVIDEWCRKDIILTKKKGGMTQVSFNPNKLIEVQKYVK